MRQIKRDFLSILKWGIAVIIVDFACQYVTIFSNDFWTTLIIGVFWGIVFCLLGVVLRSILHFVALQLYRSRTKRMNEAQPKDGVYRRTTENSSKR